MTARLAQLRPADRSVIYYLLAAGLVGFVLDGGIFSVLFNLYQLRMGYGPETIGLVSAAGQLVFAAASLPVGVLGERWGARRMLVAGMLVMGAGGALLALADLVPPGVRVGWLIANNIVLYLGLALFFVSGPPFLLALVDEPRRNAVFGRQVFTLALAAFFGSLVGGFLPQLLSGLVGAAPDAPAAFRAALLLASLSLAPATLLVLATRAAPPVADTPTAPASPAAAAAAARAVLVLFVLMGLVRLLQVGGIASTSTFFTVYLDSDLGLPTAQIGLITAVARLLGAPAALVTPLLTRRLGNHSTVMWSTVGTALIMLPLVLVPHWAAAGLSFIGVVGLSSIRYASSTVYFMALVPPSKRGTVAGVAEMAAGVSFTAMTYGGGLLVSLIGYRSLFGIGAAVTGFSALVFWLTFRPGRGARGSAGDGPEKQSGAPA